MTKCRDLRSRLATLFTFSVLIMGCQLLAAAKIVCAQWRIYPIKNIEQIVCSTPTQTSTAFEAQLVTVILQAGFRPERGIRPIPAKDLLSYYQWFNSGESSIDIIPDFTSVSREVIRPQAGKEEQDRAGELYRASPPTYSRHFVYVYQGPSDPDLSGFVENLWSQLKSFDCVRANNQ